MNSLDVGAFNPEIGNIGPSKDDYDTDDLSFLYEPITESADSSATDSSDALVSLDKIEEVAIDEEKEWNAYLDGSKGFVALNDAMSADSELNMHSESIDTIPMATIELGESEFKGRVNWVTGDTWSESGRAIGSLQPGLKSMPRYNDSSSILADKFPVVAASGIQDKDYIRTTINTPEFNLRQKIESGEIETPIDFIKSLKEFVEKDDNGYKIGDSSGDDKAIDLLSLFWEETESWSFGNPLGNKDVTLVGRGDPAQDEILRMIDEVIEEYKSLMKPTTIMQHGINRTLDEFSGDADSAMTAVTDGHITQETYDRAFPSD